MNIKQRNFTRIIAKIYNLIFCLIEDLYIAWRKINETKNKCSIKDKVHRSFNWFCI